jgi:hypothetical protein
MGHALIGTRSGIYQLDVDALIPLGLTGHHVSALHVSRDSGSSTTILAGTYGDGLFRSNDGGHTWQQVTQGLTATAFRTFENDPSQPGAILAGTEPGRIFRSVDDGQTWAELAAVGQLPRADEWYLPYSPRAGAVRNIYAPTGTVRLLGSVEVGGLISSEDGGASWAVSPILGDTDIHFVTGHPDDPGVLFAALGWASLKSVAVPAESPPLGGVARSDDGGRTWRKFHSDYTRAIIVPPTRPDLLLAAPAKKVGAQGRIEVSNDGGESWTPAMGSLESLLPDMVEVFLPAPDGSIGAVMSGGGLLRADPGEWRWKSVLPAGTSVEVRSVAFLPDA